MNKRMKHLSIPESQSKEILKLEKLLLKDVKLELDYIATMLQCSHSRCTVYISKFGKRCNNAIKMFWKYECIEAKLPI